jgi:stage II sporulation protein D
VGAGPVDLGTSLAVTIDGKEKVLEPPLRFSPGKSPLELGKPYRGSIVVTLVDGRLQAVNNLNLEKYLYGVVPGEMSSSWHREALKTQAVAARTYALVSRKTEGSFDVFADTRSQVYGGIQVEKASTSSAVNATRGKVVLYKGELAWTFYSASSGGRTAAIQQVWPDSKPVPYLVSVKDPHDDISPYHDWGPVTFTPKQLAAKLGSRLPAGLKTLEVKSNRWGRVQSVIAVGKNGSKEISGWDMRILLGLRSTWFTIDVVGNGPAA